MEEMKTSINISADSSWLSDLEMVDEYILSDDKDCNLKSNLLDAGEEQDFLSHDVASVFAFEDHRESLQQCLNTECISTTLSETFTDETSFESFDNFDFDFEKPTKQMKTFDHSATSLSSYQLPQILSFDNPNPTEFYRYDLQQKETVTKSLRNTNFSTQNSKGSSKASRAKRSPADIKDHIMAERKRREKLSQGFIALAALIPNLKRMDKASILAETIKYVKELKERLEILEKKGEEETKGRSVDSHSASPIKPEVYIDKHCSSSDESTETESAIDGSTSTESLFKMEARVLEQHMLIRIHCQKHKGVLVKIIAEIQNLELLVVNNSVLAFGDSNLDITIIAEIGEGYNLTIKELVHNLRMAALKFMSR